MSNKIHVRIGHKYEQAFKSICELVGNGCIDRSVISNCQSNQIIETDQYVFEYTGDLESIDTGSQIGMMPSGASWFSGFRGNECDNVMGIWHDLLELVAVNYHKEYSLVEYVEKSSSRSNDELEAYKRLISNIVETLITKVSRISPAAQEDSIEDLYAVAMRLEVFVGVGEPTPLLCKIYFRKKGNRFIPLSSDEAAAVDAHASKIVSRHNSSGNIDDETTETSIVDNVLNSVEKLIKGELSSNFTESILITNPIDRDALDMLISNESQDEVKLECKRLKVLGISHIQWMDNAFDVYIDNKKALFARIGLNNTVSLSCCCDANDNRLVDNNVIICKSEETGFTTKITINPEKEGLGINRDQMEQIQRNSAFASHLFPISCSEVLRRNIDCVRLQCKCNTIAFEVNGKTKLKCADCPYPEVVYRSPDGTIAYTPLLNFNTATLGISNEKTEPCRFCGRSYRQEDLNNSYLCKFCASASEAINTNTASKVNKRIYRKYAQILPLNARVAAVFKKKYAFECSDRLIFSLGKNKYFFDKLKLEDTGIIPKPEKRQ